MAAMPGALLGKKLIPCFPAGTPILTPEGAIPIEDLKPGDLVLSRDEHDVDADVGSQAVEETFVRYGEIYELRIGGRTVEVTPEHPVYVQGRGWTPAGEVAAGDLLSTLHLPVAATLVGAGDADAPSDSARWATGWQRVESIESTGEFTTVYNFRVAHWHTYFVGDDDWGFGLWVHNAYIGDLGETAVKGWLKRNGYTDVIQIQNRSGHGIDVIARHRDGTLTFFEVKTSTLARAPRPSAAQRDAGGFIRSRLQRAESGGRFWRSTPTAVQEQAAQLLAEVRAGAKYRHYRVEITNATNPSRATEFAIKPWRL